MKRLLFAMAGLALVSLTGCGVHCPCERDVLNVEAKLPDGSAANVPQALDWRVISSSVDRAHQTMAVLTGNDLAVKFAGTGAYPDGSELALVTWLERDDPHWFGARIPGSFVGLERVTVTRGADGKLTTSYKRYAGEPLHEATDVANSDARKAAILGMVYSQMP
jgi:hypothetical protein